jgi:tryptophanase
MDVNKLNEAIARLGAENIAFVRLEAGTNLIGGQPISMENMRTVSRICRENKIPTVFDASLLADNLYFIKQREAEFHDVDLRDITLEMGQLMDVTYFSGRKLGFARGGGILTSDDSLFHKMQQLIPLYEGFLTYGGMSVREMEAMAVGLEETLEIDVISQTPIFVEKFTEELQEKGVPVVTPPGGLGCHVDASSFCDHLPQTDYPAGALAAALFIVSGVRAMERGTMSEERREDGTEPLAEMELVRMALPRRVFTLSQIKYAADRLAWLHQNRHLIGGLEFDEEPAVLRFFFGTLKAKGDWPQKLAEAFRRDFGNSL